MRTKGASIEPGQKKARVVEIIGPAGAGKTSLYTSLDEFPAHIRLSNFPDVHKIADAPFFVRYGLQLLPSLARYSRPDSRPFSRREFAWMSIMVGWPTLLQKQIRTCPLVIILDQGPVYLLAEMREFGPDFIRAPKAEKFWQEVFTRWAQTLDMIVWLDAADAVLVLPFTVQKLVNRIKPLLPGDGKNVLHVGPVRLVVLDTGTDVLGDADTFPAGGPQLRWLDAVLTDGHS